MADQPEYVKTERPLIEQLTAMGWTHLRGGPADGPATNARASDRAAFTQVVYADRFREAVARINPGPDGTPWLDSAQLDHLLARLRGTAPGQVSTSRGAAGNLEATRLLREGVNSRTVPGWKQGDPEHVRLIDWDGEFTPGNDLLAVSQFRVERKGAQPATPDLVLFVNGLPWVVIECKAPVMSGTDTRAALDDAVEQAIGYAGVESPVAIPELVRFAQILVGTDRDHAEFGTVIAEPVHFAPWRTFDPASKELVRQEAGKEKGRELTAQDVLVAGIFRPAHLLTLVRDFTTQMGSGSRTVKVVGRYQQFRAVKALARTLEDRRLAVAAGHTVDQRGGVVWHTQGSGKSLTMAFLVRHLRNHPTLSGHKVVVVTDRLDLEKQIEGSLGATEEKIHRANSIKQARQYLAVDVPDLVLVTLQKAHRDDAAYNDREETLAEDSDGEDHVHNRVANPEHGIVVLIDEAHRGQARWQHARLRAMLPNAVMVGFTGTPIISGARKTTEEIFGDYADIYTLRDAEQDRSVVPVRYEAYSVPLEVVEKAVLDAAFEEQVPDDPEQRERVLRRFARRKEVLEAPSVIAAKAEHMLGHWATSALPDRFGAQVVAVSRLAAVRYRAALLEARNRLLTELDGLDPDLVHDPNAMSVATPEERGLLTVLPHRAVLASIDAAVVISQAANGRTDPEEWRPWTTKTRQDVHIERFKKGLGDPLAAATDPSWEAQTHGTDNPGWGTAGSGGEEWHFADRPASDMREEKAEQEESMAFLVVQSMLLTGFDAPVEQVLYLDCALSGAGLLQAVARTNRPYPAKKWGQIVDYIGIGPELARSMAAYDKADLRRVYGYQNVSVEHLGEDFKGEQPARDGLLLQTDAAADALLSDLGGAVHAFLARQGVTDLADETQREDLLFDALSDPLLLGEFDELVRDFLTALNAVLPRPEALEYERLAGRLGELQYEARRRYLDGRDQFSPRRYGAKVRQLISRHLKVTGIELRIPSVDLTAPDFMARVDANPDPRTKISYMTSSLRLRITAKLPGDPARYGKFSARLNEIVQQMGQDFEQAASDLARLVGEVVAAEEVREDDSGLDPWTEQPVYGLLQEQLEESDSEPWPPGVDLFQAARGLTVELAQLVLPPDIVTLPQAQITARRKLRKHLDERIGMDWELTGDLANHLVELALERRESFLLYEEKDEGREP